MSEWKRVEVDKRTESSTASRHAEQESVRGGVGLGPRGDAAAAVITCGSLGDL